MGSWPGLADDILPLPPRGLTVGSSTNGDGKVYQYTYLCEAHDECYAIGYSKISEEGARKLIAGHECPAPVRRGVLGGKSLIELMWDEADDALAAYKAGVPLRKAEGGLVLEGEHLKAYLLGVVEALTFCTVPSFRYSKDILIQLEKRWKMAQKLIPFSPTPTYRWVVFPEATRKGSIVQEDSTTREPEVAKPEAPKRQPLRKAAPPKAASAPPREFTLPEAEMVRKSIHEDGMDPEALAQMFNCSRERILSVAGPKTPVNNPVGDLFLKF